jgi:hypothetical protein
MRARSLINGLLVASIALGASGCLDTGDTVAPGIGAGIRFVNATSVPLDVLFDGQVALEGLPATRYSVPYLMEPGVRTISFRTRTGVMATATVTAEPYQTFTAVGLPGSGNTPIVAEILPDTNSEPVAGKSKVRVIHVAPAAPPVQAWRTQPDFATPIHVALPFTYGTSSNFVQSDPGEWRVWATPAAGGDSILADTGPFLVVGNALATVFLMDSAGVTVLRIVR